VILSINLDADSVTAALVGVRSRDPVVVAPHGIYERRSLDSALATLGAGCVPGHTAELRVAWLEAALGPETTGLWHEALLDAAGEWLAAPIDWSVAP
jgi:hypothetical protein